MPSIPALAQPSPPPSYTTKDVICRSVRPFSNKSWLRATLLAICPPHTLSFYDGQLAEAPDPLSASRVCDTRRRRLLPGYRKLTRALLGQYLSFWSPVDRVNSDRAGQLDLYTTRLVLPMEGDPCIPAPRHKRVNNRHRNPAAALAHKPHQDARAPMILFNLLREIGPVHHVTIGAEGEHQWIAEVQFFHTDDANKLDDMDGMTLFGSKVEVFVLPMDVEAEASRNQILADEAARIKMEDADTVVHKLGVADSVHEPEEVTAVNNLDAANRGRDSAVSREA